MKIHPAVAAFLVLVALGVAGAFFWNVWNYKEPQKFGIKDLGKVMSRQAKHAPAADGKHPSDK